MEKERGELMELKHEAEPGYKTAFYTVLTIASLYLAFILLTAR